MSGRNEDVLDNWEEIDEVEVSVFSASTNSF